MAKHLNIHKGHAMENLRDDVKDMKRSAINLKDDLQELGDAAKTLASDSVQSVKQNLSGIYEKGQERVASMESQVESRIKKYPVQTLLIAAGVGFVIGLLKR